MAEEKKKFKIRMLSKADLKKLKAGIRAASGDCGYMYTCVGNTNAIAATAKTTKGNTRVGTKLTTDGTATTTAKPKPK